MTQPPPDSIEALLDHLQAQFNELTDLTNPDTCTIYSWVPAACEREALERRAITWIR